VIWKEGVNVRGLNTAATLLVFRRCRFAGRRRLLAPRLLAAVLVVGVNLVLRPLVSLVNRQPIESADIETSYIVNVTCQAADEARIRAPSGARCWGQRPASARTRKHRNRRNRPD